MSTTEVTAYIMKANKSYEQHQVLKDVSLTIHSGEIIGLIGPSGAGKTTLIKCLMGMEQIDSGKVTVLNQSMPNREILSRIGYMGQSDALYEELTARENLIFYGKLMGMNDNLLNKNIIENMSLVNLGDFIDKKVKTYSGGMKRRLSLAITLLAQTDLLVLDEPTVGIDPSLRVSIWHQLRILADKNKAIIVTTHVMDEAEKCDKVGLIIEGQLFAYGSPFELKQQFSVETIEEVFLKAEVNANDAF